MVTAYRESLRFCDRGGADGTDRSRTFGLQELTWEPVLKTFLKLPSQY